MSNLSLKAALREDKFNLRTIGVILILVDISLFNFFFEFSMLLEFFYLVLYQASIIIALLFGLRGQGKYKSMMIQLQSIARNRDLDIDERDNRLVSMIHHACLELGYIYEERNKEYGLFTKKKIAKSSDKSFSLANNNVPKKTKNLEVKNKVSLLIIDTVVWKQIGYMVVGIWGVFSPVIAMLLEALNFHWAIILFIMGSWVFVDIFIAFYLHYIFGLPMQEAKYLNAKAAKLERELSELEKEVVE